MFLFLLIDIVIIYFYWCIWIDFLWLNKDFICVICLVDFVILLNVFCDKWMIECCVIKLFIESLFVNLVVWLVGSIWFGFVI